MRISDWSSDVCSSDLVRWEGPEASVDFRFEAFHPPYAYSTHAGGCPPYAADDRIEQSGRITGTLRIGDRVIDIRTMGHRDHSWGTRDWGALHFYRWLQSQAGEDMRSEEHTSELQSLMRIPYAVF